MVLIDATAVGPDGIIRTVAGVCGTSGNSGDGGPADQALLRRPYGLELTADSLVISDTGNSVIRSVRLSHAEEDIRMIIDVYNDAWSDNFHFVPMTEPELAKMAERQEISAAGVTKLLEKGKFGPAQEVFPDRAAGWAERAARLGIPASTVAPLGMGAALLTPGSLAILQATFREEDRGRAIGAWSGLGGIAAALGPFLGGWLVGVGSWRLVFLINVPLALLVVVVALRHVPETVDPQAPQRFDVPGALLMKLAVNTFLISMVTGLAEAFHFAAAHGLDAERLRTVLDAGPMASTVSRVKAHKLTDADFEVQASIRDVHCNSRLVADAARRAGVSSPVLDTCRDLVVNIEIKNLPRDPDFDERCSVVDAVVALREQRGRGDRVLVSCITACGTCRYCRAGHENLCDEARFTGYHRDGGFAEYARLPDDGNRYEVDAALVGRTVDLLFTPFDLTVIDVGMAR